jgi:predicted metal-dependent hydrolase
MIPSATAFHLLPRCATHPTFGRMFGLFKREPTPPARIEVVHQGTLYPVEVKRSARARRYTLRVRAATRDAVLTVPARGSITAAKDFANRQAGWLAARLAKLPSTTDIAPGVTIPLRGEPHAILHDGAMRGSVRLGCTADGAPAIIVSGPADFARRRVLDFLHKEAAADLAKATRRHAATLGVSIQRITVKDTKSRWGSCSSTGAISYSWRMIMAPAFVLDYLCAHEVAHRLEMNHSVRFWRIVQKLYPDFERAEAWLKRNGAALHLIG